MSMVTLPSNIKASCSDCGFSSQDSMLLKNHSCDVQRFGGYCEDFPCCGHEAGDCNGLLYGSDEAIKESVYSRSRGYEVTFCEDCESENIEGGISCKDCGSENVGYEHYEPDDWDF